MRSILWDSLFNLTGATLRNAEFKASGLSISNTALTNLFFVRLTATDTWGLYTPAPIAIQDNQKLSIATLFGLQNASHEILISDNYPSIRVSFHDMITAASISLSHVDNINLPNLATATRLEISSNTISTFSLPELTSIDGDFFITDNEALNTVTLPLLGSIGNSISDRFVVSRNPNRYNMDLGSLEEVGAINISGPFLT